MNWFVGSLLHSHNRRAEYSIDLPEYDFYPKEMLVDKDTKAPLIVGVDLKYLRENLILNKSTIRRFNEREYWDYLMHIIQFMAVYLEIISQSIDLDYGLFNQLNPENDMLLEVLLSVKPGSVDSEADTYDEALRLFEYANISDTGEFIKYNRKKYELRIGVIEDAAKHSLKCLEKSKKVWLEHHERSIWKF